MEWVLIIIRQICLVFAALFPLHSDVVDSQRRMIFCYYYRSLKNIKRWVTQIIIETDLKHSILALRLPQSLGLITTCTSFHSYSLTKELPKPLFPLLEELKTCFLVEQHISRLQNMYNNAHSSYYTRTLKLKNENVDLYFKKSL